MRQAITELEAGITESKGDLEGDLEDVLEEKNKAVEKEKKTALRASKMLPVDSALKDIVVSVMVGCWTDLSFSKTT